MKRNRLRSTMALLCTLCLALLLPMTALAAPLARVAPDGTSLFGATAAAIAPFASADPSAPIAKPPVSSSLWIFLLIIVAVVGLRFLILWLMHRKGKGK